MRGNSIMSDKKVTLDVKKLYEMGVHKLDLYVDANGIGVDTTIGKDTSTEGCKCGCGTGCHNKANHTEIKENNGTKEKDTDKTVDDFYGLLYNLGDINTKAKENSNIKEAEAGVFDNVGMECNDNKNKDTCGKDIDGLSLIGSLFGLGDSTKRKECSDNLIKGLINSLKELDANNDFHSMIRKIMEA